MSAVIGNIFEKWLQDFVSFGNPCIYSIALLSAHMHRAGGTGPVGEAKTRPLSSANWVMIIAFINAFA